MPKTWEAFSKEIIGYVAPYTEGNEDYVTVGMIQKWLDSGMTTEGIFRKWNQGSGSECRRGVNAQGVQFDSCKYVQLAMNHYKNN